MPRGVLLATWKFSERIDSEAVCCGRQHAIEFAGGDLLCRSDVLRVS